MKSIALKPLAKLALTAAIGLSLPLHALAADTVVLDTSYGEIELELDSDKAPQTVQNFLTYAREGYYNGLIFHRVIPGFMIQGGGMDTEFKPRTTHPAVANESANGLSNQRGTIAMARTRDPDSATSQFFINSVDNSANLDGQPGRPGYTVFGQVTRGMEVVDSISQVDTTSRAPYRDVPVTPVVINEVRVLSAGQ